MKHLKILTLFFFLFTCIILLVGCGECKHEFTDWEVIKAPSCTESGLKISNCNLCELSKTDSIDPTGHESALIEAVPPTCIMTGLSEGVKCKTCNMVLEEPNTTPKGKHNFSDGICSVCSAPYYSEGLIFTLNDDDSSFSVSKGTCKDKNVVIPDTYDGLPVTRIGEKAFRNLSTMESIVIPSTVAYIGSSAFYACSNLKSMTIPFVGESQESSGVSGMFGYIFGEEEYPGSTKASQSYSSFFVKSFYIPTTLTSVTLLSPLKFGCFSGCTTLKEINIPEDTTSIPAYAFYGCSSLTEFPITPNVTKIGACAYRSCIQCTNISLGTKLESIGSEAFWDCDSLIDILVHPDNQTFKSILGNVYSKDGSILIQYAVGKSDETFTIPSEVLEIGDEAFATSTHIKEVVLVNVSKIGASAFFDCIALAKITMSKSLTTVGGYAFQNCVSLESVTLPNGVLNIERYAFSKCSKLKEIFIPSTVITIGEGAFWRSYDLTIYCQHTQQPTTWDDEWNLSDCPIYWNKSSIPSSDKDIV